VPIKESALSENERMGFFFMPKKRGWHLVLESCFSRDGLYKKGRESTGSADFVEDAENLGGPFPSFFMEPSTRIL